MRRPPLIVLSARLGPSCADLLPRRVEVLNPWRGALAEAGPSGPSTASVSRKREALDSWSGQLNGQPYRSLEVGTRLARRTRRGGPLVPPVPRSRALGLDVPRSGSGPPRPDEEVVDAIGVAANTAVPHQRGDAATPLGVASVREATGSGAGEMWKNEGSDSAFS